MTVNDLKIAAYKGKRPEGLDTLERGLYGDMRNLYVQFFNGKITQTKAQFDMGIRIIRYEKNRIDLGYPIREGD